MDRRISDTRPAFDDYTNGPAGILSLENANRIAMESGAQGVWNMNQVFSNTSPGIGPRFRHSG